MSVGMKKWFFVMKMSPISIFTITSQAVQLGSRERLLAFCDSVQRSCPVGSYVKPISGTTPGYASEVSLLPEMLMVMDLKLCFAYTPYEPLLCANES